MINTSIQGGRGRVVSGDRPGGVAKARRSVARVSGRRLVASSKPSGFGGVTRGPRVPPSYAITNEEVVDNAEPTLDEAVEANDQGDASSEENQKRGNRRGGSRRPQNTEKVKEAVANLKEGDMIKGKVRKIESFGAFVDINVGKDALIHISQLSTKFTKNVGDHLEEGQEVEARLLSIDLDSLRIQLSLISEEEQAKAKSEGGERKRKPKQRRPKETLKVGETIVGKIASVRPFGCFVELGDNKTGLVHVSEIIDDDSLDTLSDMNLEAGQKLEVVIAEINEKKREYKLRPSEKALQAMVPEEEVYVEQSSIPPSMPFFMKEFGVIRSMYPDNPSLSYIPVGLNYKTGRLPKNPDGRTYKVVGSTYSDASNWSDVISVGEPEEESKKKQPPTAEAAVVEQEAEDVEAAPAEAEAVAEEEEVEEKEAAPEAVAAEEEKGGEEEEKPKAAISAKVVKELRDMSGAGMMDCKKALTECGGDIDAAEEYLRKKGIVSAAKKASRVASEGMVSSYIHAGSRIGVLIEVNSETDFVARGDVFKELVQGLAMQIAASPSVEYVAPEDAPADFVEAEKAAEMQKEDLASKPENIREKIVQGRVDKIVNERALLEQAWIMDNNKTVGDAITEAVASIGENIKVRRFSRYVLGEGIEKKQENFADEVAAQTKAKEDAPAEAKKEKAPAAEEKGEEEEKPKVAISAKVVKELRDMSGAGMMDCKKALAECGGDIDAAEEYLRKKGIVSAAKKASRVASEGMVSSYIHAGSRIGVLIEVNSETDFVARGDVFKELVQGLAMQIAASPSVEYVAPEDAPADFVEAEKAAEMQKEDLASKPENIREKIVQGRVDKIVNERALLEQAWIMDNNKTVGDAITEAIASIGENIKVRRFSRYVLGEGIEKKQENFADEVAAQMKST
ncbi:translation elongation factor Ts [Chloropicon primus]|uniref:Elongation factor Ts, mitochondrial n=2 Tax=Chloropicon primus TaxID=1764295 RepID=A0A5B8MC38_9CHLO|nr:translation elongation factor Ts [Chloropicon primus]UPQ97138.1 translation elongation factor Ts [Chloropicon primus]|eukprot:QDZ17923.1 translation elongation factor Ts [Chloropicon primus]